MKFRIEGREYAAAEVGRLSLADIDALEDQAGMTVAQLEEAGEYLSGFDEDSVAMLSDRRARHSLGAFVWLARLNAGDEVSFAESMRTPMAEIEMVAEDGDEVEAPDPTVSVPAVTGAGVPAAPAPAVAAV